ncbi:MAG: DUF58 domain-containing protein [Actinomycetota bacterium]
MPAALLQPAELEALRRLQLRARRRVATGGSGQHRARGHGSSLDFDDYRPYQPGDDPRRVDHHAHQRLGRLLVKLFEAEDEVGLQVVVDTSASMAFGDKATVACRLAAALAVTAVLGGDRVRLVTTGGAEAVGPWQRGRPAVGATLARLTDVRDRLVATPPVPADAQRLEAEDPALAALRRCLPASGRGPVVLIGDLLTPGWADVVRLLGAGRAGGALVHVVGRDDLDPWLDDDPRLVDADRGTEVDGAATAAARRRFVERRDAWLDGVDATAGAAGVTCLRVVDDLPVEAQILTLPRSGVVG